MPVDPLEGARERLRRIAAGETEYTVYVRGQKLRIGQSGSDYLRADLKAILAELDRRSPPTCETCGGRGEIGGWVGQTAESGGYETEPCPDCSPPTREGGVEQQYSSLRFAPQPASRGKPPMDEPESAAGAAWRRGIMHAVERIDAALALRPPPRSKADALLACQLVSCELDALTEFQRQHFPADYKAAFALCVEDHKRRVGVCPTPPEQSAAGHPDELSAMPARERAEGDAERTP